MHKIEVQFSQNLARFAVSLFTREWIEIIHSLVKRETESVSPSLRGSGLKYHFPCRRIEERAVSLFTREWIEILSKAIAKKPILSLPLYEGVD